MLNINVSNLGTALKDAEKQILEAAMVQNKFNQSKAAKSVGLSRGAFRYKLKEYFPNKYI